MSKNPASKIFFLFMLIFSLSSCSWIATDTYFQREVDNKSAYKAASWSHEFRPGRTSTKWSGYPDSMLLSFDGSGFKLTVSASDQDVVSVGPLVFPIIPFFSDFDGNLSISVALTAKLPARLNTGSWTITDLSNSKIYKAINQEQLIITEATKFTVSFPIKASDISSFKLQVGAFTIGQDQVTPPALQLIKTKGTWHFEQFTL